MADPDDEFVRGIRKRRISNRVDSTSSSEEEKESRISERLKKKRTKLFVKPKRDDVWKSITPSKSPSKYDHLKPRKTVNNFTKENNRYNFDPLESSGEESLEDFIVDQDESDSDTASDDDATFIHKSTPRIQGRRKRIFTESDSDTCDVLDLNIESALGEESQTSSKQEYDRVEDSEVKHLVETAYCSDSHSDQVVSPKRTNQKSKSTLIDSESDEDISQPLVTKVESTNESDTNDSDNDSDENVSPKRSHKRTIKSAIESDCSYEEDELQGENKSEENWYKSREQVSQVSTSTIESNNTIINENTHSSKSDDVMLGTDQDDESDQSIEGAQENIEDEEEEEVLGRVRIGQLRKKQEKQRLFEKIRKERERKMLKNAKISS
ncbi:clumping factor A-like isoform X2 [Dreissena polymorpha]|uniref:clumping factor A-like isoform X2 n=1 Tax=Dreissena polymorpha TaxID=45954 RepID=UPI00226445AE|nr:clumping factor A-like isoform X2 [Dreissena polymorpha]